MKKIVFFFFTQKKKMENSNLPYISVTSFCRPKSDRKQEDHKITQVISVTELSTVQQDILWKAIEYTVSRSLHDFKQIVSVKPTRKLVFSQPGYIEYACVVTGDTNCWDKLKQADFPMVSFKPSDFCAKLPRGILSLTESEKEVLLLQLKADRISYVENKLTTEGYLESLYENRDDIAVPKILMKLALRTNTKKLPEKQGNNSEDSSEYLSEYLSEHSTEDTQEKLPFIYVVADYDNGVENIICMTTCKEDMENIYDLYPFYGDVRCLYEVSQGMINGIDSCRSSRSDWHKGCENPKYSRSYGWY